MTTARTDPVVLRRVERVIGVLAPALDVLLAVGKRSSRVIERDDPYHAPPRMARGGEFAPRGPARLPWEDK